jgi:hypothetical protein
MSRPPIYRRVVHVGSHDSFVAPHCHLCQARSGRCPPLSTVGQEKRRETLRRPSSRTRGSGPRRRRPRSASRKGLPCCRRAAPHRAAAPFSLQQPARGRPGPGPGRAALRRECPSAGWRIGPHCWSSRASLALPQPWAPTKGWSAADRRGDRPSRPPRAQRDATRRGRGAGGGDGRAGGRKQGQGRREAGRGSGARSHLVGEGGGEARRGSRP